MALKLPGSAGPPASFQEALDQLLAAHRREIDSARGELGRAREALALAQVDSLNVPAAAPVCSQDSRSEVTRDVSGVSTVLDSKELSVPPVCHASPRSSVSAPRSPASGPRSPMSNRTDGIVDGVPTHTLPRGRASSRVSGSRKLSKDSSQSGIKWQMHQGVQGSNSVFALLTKFGHRVSERLATRLDQMRHASKREERFMYKLTKSTYFVALSYFLIIMNSLFIGASMQYQLACAMSGCVEMDMWWDHVELIFDVAFSVELATKFMAEDVLMFLGKDCTWNCLDLLLVVSAIAQRAAESGTPKLSVTRNVRLFRVTRILRVIRVVKICQSLRIMIFAILKSLDALLWVFAVLIFFKYLFAMVFMHATTEEFREYGNTSAEHLIKLKHDFGGLLQSFCTLFKVITNGRSWDEVYDSLSEVHAIYGLVFLAYVYFTVFLVLNVVVGTVVDVTSRVALRDRDRKVTEEMSKVKEYAEDVRQFFSMADSNKSGTLSWEEFCEYLEDDKTKAHFQSLDLDISQAHVLFDLLDDNGDGVVGIREFLDGCIRLRGQARSIDLHLAIFQLQQLLSGSSTLSRAIANSRPVRQAGTEAWRS